MFVNQNNTSCMTSKKDFVWFPIQPILSFYQVKAMVDVGSFKIQPNIKFNR